ncbi:MAG: undecaprenyl diphosphate synthase family protein [Ilumatobacteraceae bacterium]
MAARTSLSHVLLCAGSLHEWAQTSVDAWRARLTLVSQVAHGGGAEWATIIPHGSGSESDVSHIRQLLVESCGGVQYADRVVVLGDEGVTVIVDLCADGRQRIADAVNRMTTDDVTEQRLAATLSAPAPGEPDLVIVLGSASAMPASLVWEIAYAELVFLDAPWGDLNAEHLEMAIDDFARRDRRFGGIDS